MAGLQYLMIQMEKRIKRRPSLKKPNPEKPMNMTMASALYSTKDLHELKLPPLQGTMRRTTAKLPPPKKLKERNETETTAMESEMFKSYYQAMEKSWVKPSEYMQGIGELKLGGGSLDMADFQVRLNENVEKNMARIESLNTLISKWAFVLRKVISYLNSRKSTSPHLIEEVSFWRILSKKFDELEYEFKDQKTNQLLTLAKSSIKAKPELSQEFEEFVRLRDEAVSATPYLKKLHMSLEESVAGNIQRFAENSDIVTSIEYLKRILLGFQATAENCELLRPRMPVVFEKMHDAMVQKLTAAPLYPRELANISGLKEKYEIIDKALSFYSNFISAAEEHEGAGLQETIQKAEYTRGVLVNLLQILGYFQFLYKKKEVLEFSKLFSVQLDFVIYEDGESREWKQFMDRVEESMERKQYEP